MVNTTHIGSLPFKTIGEAIQFNKSFTLPVLSTLPLMSDNEYMLAQILTGIKGASYKNYNIELKENYKLIDYKIPFIIEEEFIKSFEGQDIKWQVVGIVTLLKSLKSLNKDEYLNIINWHAKNIINYHKFLSTRFSKVYLFLDEPMYKDINDKNWLHTFLEKISSAGIDLNIHCCHTISLDLFSNLNLEGLSFDYTQLQETNCTYLEKHVNRLYLGVVNTVTLQRINSYPVKEVYYFTPACGLAFSDPEKVLNIPKILNSRTNCS